MAQVAETRMTAEEYALLGESTLPMELIHGEIVMSPAPIDEHQVLAITFLDLLRDIAPAGKRRIAPCDVYLSKHDVVQPDVFWVSSHNTGCKLGADKHWHGAPDLVIEILSPATALRDRREKFALYEKHGVREYWLADPATQLVEVYRLKDRKFERAGVFGPEDSFESSALGVTIALNKVFVA
jgi:Uma2 family endonuclease